MYLPLLLLFGVGLCSSLQQNTVIERRGASEITNDSVSQDVMQGTSAIPVSSTQNGTKPMKALRPKRKEDAANAAATVNATVIPLDYGETGKEGPRVEPKDGPFGHNDSSSCNGSRRTLGAGGDKLPTMLELPSLQTVVGRFQTERRALLVFKADANSSSDALASWVPRQPNYCLWIGVQCDSRGFVTEINLPATNLTGTIAESLRNLSRLSSLDLSRNRLQSSLPDTVGGLPSLQYIRLQRNRITAIPDSIWRTSLKALDASSNALYGTFPWSMTNATQLVQLRLAHNWLFGRLPPALSRLGRLEAFEIAFNRMSTDIPPSLGGLPKLTNLDLSGNAFSGPIPPALGRTPSLISLSLSRNFLNGSIPIAIGSLTSLESLDLSRNKLEGQIPPQLGALKSLKNLSLALNNLSGSVPGALSTLTSLNLLNLGGNEFTGTVPEFLTALSSLVFLRLRNNQLSGTIPQALTALGRTLTTLDLSGNQLTGDFPEFVTGLSSLSVLNLGHNNLTGVLPSSLRNIPGLRSLVVPNNPQLGGLLPAWTASFTSLQALNVSNCNLTGPMPSTLFNMVNLTRFDFSYNFFRGLVPQNALVKTGGGASPFRWNCLLYSNATPQNCPYVSRNGYCYLTGQRPLGQCVPPTPPGPTGVNSALGTGILIFFCLVCLITMVALALFYLCKDSIAPIPFLPWRSFEAAKEGGSSGDAWDTMYLEGSDGALLIADTELPGMPPGIKRYTMDEVWTATANFSAYLDPDDLRPAFHGRINRLQKVTVRLMPLPEEHIEESKHEFVERVVALSRFHNPNILKLEGYAYEDGCFVAVFEAAQETLFERLHSADRSLEARPLSWRERMRIMVALADAIEYLHTTRFSKSTTEDEGEEGEEEDEEEEEEDEEDEDEEEEEEERRKKGKRRNFGFNLKRRKPKKQPSPESNSDDFSREGPFIHGDIKSSNILLMSGNRGKLFDSLVPRNPEEDPLRSVSAHGSFGYLDPNYADTKRLTPASDVYSFGVLLLEIISGRPSMEEDAATLIVMAQDYFVLRDDYPKLLDPALEVTTQSGHSLEGVPRQELVAMVELVQSCTQVQEDSRPTISWVKEQMTTSLQMGPEEYNARAQTEIQSASEIEIELMSEGSPGRLHDKQRLSQPK